jgi:hypothetical protein
LSVKAASGSDRRQRTYNQTWIVERHGYRMPAQVRADQLGLAAVA